MSQHVTQELSAYLDHELDAARTAEVDAHLAGCAECRQVLEDLRHIVAAAAEYPGREPSRDLWTDISRHLDDSTVVPLVPSRHRFGWRELLAASVLMATAGGGAVWFALRGGPARAGVEAAASLGDTLGPEVHTVAFADAKYDRAVTDLEGLLAAGRSRLDSSTVRTIEESLARIDAAIAEARAAIQRDPANAYLSRQITANMRRKLNLLRVATNAIAAKS